MDTEMGQGDDSSQVVAACAKPDIDADAAQLERNITYDNSTTRKTKSRYGCRGCKARRKLKCDETHPACLQCLRRGRECPGYARDFKFSDKHEKLRFGGKDKSKNRKRKASTEFQEATLTGRTNHSTILGTKEANLGSQTRHLQHEANDNEKSLAGNDMLQKKVTEMHQQSKNDESEAGRVLNDFAKRGDASPKMEQQESLDPIDELPFGSAEPHFDMMAVIFAESLSLPESSRSDESTGHLQVAAPTTNISASQFDDQAIDASKPLPTELEPCGEQDDHDRDRDATEASRTPPLLPNSKRRRTSDQLIQKAKSRIPNTLIDLPTTLIEYWFTHVCGMWSAYDSESNPNRQLALDHCFSSEPVFFALQSMSAACLVDSLPHLKPVLASTSGNALAAINREMAMYYDLNSELDGSLPTDLLLSIFAMATSLCWTDTKQLGEPLVTGARTILMRYQDVGGLLHHQSQKELSHFRHALKYTEMLLNFVSSESAYADLEVLRQRHRLRLRHVMGWEDDRDSVDEEPVIGDSRLGPEKEEDDHDSVLHPWTGVSKSVQETFGLAMALCRDHHTRRTCNSMHSANALCESLCDIEVAREISHHLMQSGFASVEAGYRLPSHLHTGDQSTPITHLLDTAEAYRLAALLQLYITFPDLDVRLDDSSSTSVPPCMGNAGEMERDQALTTLTLLLVDVLERIPPESGTRCIQPVLYVSAATGLRFDTPVVADSGMPSLTQCTIEVSRARKFIVDRLSTLLRSLPPRPIGVALNLIKAIWSEYDYGQSTAAGGHWMDVMMKTGLHTLFG